MISVPPFNPSRATGVDGETTWFFTQPGAIELVRRIRDVWREAGWDIQVWVEWERRADNGRKEWIVRSDLVNGLPRANTPRWGVVPQAIEAGEYRRRAG